ncbi:MAG: GGDEF domain-containing response regulator [Phycisphaerales bacterium]
MTDDHMPQLDDTPVVLLMDDSKFVHRILDSRLRSESISFIGEYNGRAGFDRAKNDLPSLILLDLDMPVMDGYETLRALKEEPSTRDIPVIVLSGMNSSQDKVAAFDLGAVDFVTKPFELAELRARVRSSLKMSALLKMLAQKAQIDGLSGLFNRAYFDHRFQEEFDRAIRHGHGLSMGLIDLDHFKSVNDTYGHPAGDAVITGVAQIIQSQCRNIDIACRYGGEEFVLIMPETSPDQAFSVCERIRSVCEEKVWAQHPSRPITLSCGLIGTDDGSGIQSTTQAILEAVDQNLYRAKQGGRNQIIGTYMNGTPLDLAKAG